MRRDAIGLRTHILLYAALVVVFATALTAAFHYRSGELERLDEALQKDILVLNRVSDLRREARQINFAVELFTNNGDRQLLPQIHQSETGFRRALAEILRDSEDHAEAPHLSAFSEAFLKKERELLDRKKPPQAELSAAREKREEVIESATAMRDAAVADLEHRIALEERSFYAAFFIRMIVEFLAATAVGIYLYLFMLRPIQAAEQAAASWRLGEPWPEASFPAIPEMRSLLARFSEMAGRLNGQFEREKEFSEFKTKLVSIASHEFGNSLAVIFNAVYLLKDRAAPEALARDKDLFRMIEMHSQMLNTVASNFLNMGRLEAGKLVMALKETDLAAAVRETGVRLEALASAKRVALRVELAEGPSVVSADLPALNMVLNNLVGNAIKYTPAGGSVTIGTRGTPENPDAVRIYVSDTGIGVAEADRSKILGGYYRTEEGRQMTGGFGIGLSLARQVVEAHGSRLELESASGKGSTFSFVMRRAVGRN